MPGPDTSAFLPPPKHIAIIMDGNGRWATARGLPRTAGHKKGVDAVRQAIEGAPDLGIDCLTVFGFSTENWSRPEDEVSDLMGLVRSYVASDLARLTKAGVRLKILGRRQGLPADIAAIIERAEAQTAHNDRFLLQVAFNYGGRADIVDAARAYVEKLQAGEPVGPLDEDSLGAGLSTAGGPPVDVIVRTSGERRLSNFLLWEAAYAEMVFQNVLWPDYGAGPLGDAVDAYRLRDRSAATWSVNMCITLNDAVVLLAISACAPTSAGLKTAAAGVPADVAGPRPASGTMWAMPTFTIVSPACWAAAGRAASGASSSQRALRRASKATPASSRLRCSHCQWLARSSSQAAWTE